MSMARAYRDDVLVFNTFRTRFSVTFRSSRVNRPIIRINGFACGTCLIFTILQNSENNFFKDFYLIGKISNDFNGKFRTTSCGTC